MPISRVPPTAPTLAPGPSAHRKRRSPTLPHAASALLDWRPLPGDMRAAWVSALIMLPQAIAFAVLAGLPPEMGIYSSIVPVIVASLLGASPRLLSGPNTAVAMMIGPALAPLAVPGSNEYIAYAAVLTLLVGVAQFVGALGGIGRILEQLPRFTSTGLSLGIGLVMLTCQIAPALGLMSSPNLPSWLAPWVFAERWHEVNPWAVLVTGVTIATGQLFAWLRKPWMPGLIAALLAGAASGWVLDLCVGMSAVHLDRLGHLQLEFPAPVLPIAHIDDFYAWKQLAASAIGIAVVASLQSVLILRSLAVDAGHRVCRRELLAQAAANLCASVFSGFACSGSFNRTASHVDAGAVTRAAVIMSSLILLGIGLLAAPVYAYVPRAAIAGALALVGWSMVRSGWKSACADKGFARAATLALGVSVPFIGMQTALMLALVLAVLQLLLHPPRQSSDTTDHEKRVQQRV